MPALPFVLVVLSFGAPYSFFQAVHVARKKHRLLEEYATQGKTVRGAIKRIQYQRYSYGVKTCVLYYAYRPPSQCSSEEDNHDYQDEEDPNSEMVIVKKKLFNFGLPSKSLVSLRRRGFAVRVLPDLPRSGLPNVLIENTQKEEPHGTTQSVILWGVLFFVLSIIPCTAVAYVLRLLIPSFRRHCLGANQENRYCHSVFGLCFAISATIQFCLGFMLAHWSYRRWETQALGTRVQEASLVGTVVASANNGSAYVPVSLEEDLPMAQIVSILDGEDGVADDDDGGEILATVEAAAVSDNDVELSRYHGEDIPTAHVLPSQNHGNASECADENEFSLRSKQSQLVVGSLRLE